MSLLRVIGLLALAATTVPTLAQAPGDVMPNGSFEDGMTGWRPSVNDPQRIGAAVTVDRTQAKQGATSLRISLPGPASAAITSDPAPVQPGQDYLLSFWYRSEGFSETGLYAGVNLQYVLSWLDASKKPVGAGGTGLSYGAVPEWRFMVNLITPPPDAAFVTLAFPMTVGATGRPSSFWLDRVRLRPWPGQPRPGGKTWRFHVADGAYQHELFRRVADDDTDTGFAVLANPRFQRRTGYLAGGFYTRAVPPGQYRAVFRLKVAEIPAPSKAPLAWDVNTDSIGLLSAGAIGADTFTRAGAYQDVPVRFVLPPGVQWIDPRLTWNGGAAVWIDTISIVEEKIFTAGDIRLLVE